MRSWLMTKAEEEKRKQEEEKTRQESLKLEQRKIEQNMLLESIRNGVPPPLVPIIFAGIGGTNLGNLSIEWLQQYANSLQVAQQQQLAAQAQGQSSPDIRRDRLISQSQPYSSAPQVPPGPPSASAVPGQSIPGSAGSPYGFQGGSAMSPSVVSRQPSGAPPAHTSAPRAPLQNVLPRLTTNEMQAPQGPPTATGGPVQPSTAHTAQSEQTSSSPSIYFHHWVPPSSQGASGNPPATPSGKRQK